MVGCGDFGKKEHKVMKKKEILKTKINVLKAHEGDSIIIETYDIEKNKYIILIDGGPRQTFKTTLVKELDKYQRIDLLILTHIDNDHIAGLIQYLSSSHADKHSFGKLLVNAPNLLKCNDNGTQISISEGIEFEKIINKKYPNLEIIGKITSEIELKLNLPEGIDIKILSPNQAALDELIKNWREIDFNKEENTQLSSTELKAKDFDKSFKELAEKKTSEKKISRDFANASSIAFSIKTIDFHGLFLGDSHSSIVTESIKNKYQNNLPVKFDYIKISHHGSKYNISNNFLDTIESNKFIISTNGGLGIAKHPDRQTLAKIVSHKNMQKEKVQFFFNYSLSDIEKKTGKLFKDEELKLFEYHEINEITT